VDVHSFGLLIGEAMASGRGWKVYEISFIQKCHQPERKVPKKMSAIYFLCLDCLDCLEVTVTSANCMFSPKYKKYSK